MTPILILSSNRFLMLKDMIESIEAHTDPMEYEIIICDNASTNNLLKEYYKTIRHKVIHNENNEGFLGFNKALGEIKAEYFIITDPDLMMNKSLPSTWIQDMKNVMDETNAAKVSFTIKLDYGNEPEFLKRFTKTERGYFGNPVEVTCIKDSCFFAPVDTAFAMVKRDTYLEWSTGLMITKEMLLEGMYLSWTYNPKYAPPVRIGGKYEMEHLGWCLDSKYVPDVIYYMLDSNRDYSTMSTILDQVWKYHENKIAEEIEKYTNGHIKAGPGCREEFVRQFKIPSMRNKMLRKIHEGYKNASRN